MITMQRPPSVSRAKPTDQEAIDWRRLALRLDRILQALWEEREPAESDLLEAKRLRAKLGL